MQLDYSQLNAAENLRSGNILMGRVGSGKSRTALLYYYKYVCGGDVAINGEGVTTPRQNPIQLIIITTAAKRDKHEWELELPYFLLRKEEVIINSWNNIAKYREFKDCFFIFDEQRVVGSGKWVRSFLKIAKNNQWILLTATPGDTWSDYIPVFVANGFYKNRTAFLAEHAVFSRFTTYPKIERYIGCDKLLRFKKQIVVPIGYESNKLYYHHWISCDYNVKDYEQINKDWNIFEDKPIYTASEKCYLLRKVVNSHTSRILKLLDIYKKRHKLIVFYNFDYELLIIRSALTDAEIIFAEWNGHEHRPVPSGENWIYLVQYNAGAEGWECKDTDTIVFYSLNYSYKMIEQAKGRIDRRTSPYTSLYYYFLSSDSSIDNAITKSILTKRRFNENTFVKTESQKKHGL